MEPKSIKSIKRSLVKVYGQLKKSSTPELEIEYKVLKRDLRCCQRREKYLDELREVGKLEQVSKSKNRNLFWRFAKKMKKKRSNEKEIMATPLKLLDFYKSLYGLKLYSYLKTTNYFH